MDLEFTRFGNHGRVNVFSLQVASISYQFFDVNK